MDGDCLPLLMTNALGPCPAVPPAPPSRPASPTLPRSHDLLYSILRAITLKGVLAQRLVRRLCVKCKQQKSTTNNDYLPKSSVVFESTGCNYCNGTGYSGRVGLFEFFNINDEIKKSINNGASEDELVKLSCLNHNRLFESGIKLVKEGITSIEEVLRVTKEL